jgi:hypothetical protein
LREFAGKELLESVGEVMDHQDLKVNSESIFSKILKIVMSIMFFVSIVAYVTTGKKKLEP